MVPPSLAFLAVCFLQKGTIRLRRYGGTAETMINARASHLLFRTAGIVVSASGHMPSTNRREPQPALSKACLSQRINAASTSPTFETRTL